MKSLAALLIVAWNVPAVAQTRARSMGEFRVDSNGVSIVAAFQARSTGEVVLDVNERIAQPASFSSLHCTVAADGAAGWADSTTTLVNQQVSRPPQQVKIEFEGPVLPSRDCLIRVDRTVYPNGSTYSLLIVSRALIGAPIAAATVTQAQALAFIGRVRGTAAVALGMRPNAVAPGLPTNPNIATDTSPSPTSAEHPYFEFQVEKQATPLPGSPHPAYPDLLRAANVEGEVLAQFVVDTAGRAEMGSFKVLKSSHPLFTSSVKATVPAMLFSPAEIAGRKVRQLVQMPFIFGLNPLPPGTSASRPAPS